jgi:hypothetical protein
MIHYLAPFVMQSQIIAKEAEWLAREAAHVNIYARKQFVVSV